MATTTITPMHAHPTATMDQAGSRAESLLAPGRGAVAGGAMATMAVGDSMGDAATTDAGRPIPGAEDFAVGTAMGMPAATLTVEADRASRVVAEAEADSMEEVATSAVEAEADSMAEAETSAVEVVAGSMAEAETTVVGAGRLHHKLEAQAAGGICCQPLRFRSCGAAASCGPRRARRGRKGNGKRFLSPGRGDICTKRRTAKQA
ncbi:MAG: hypothetical protein ACLQVM_08125 [Terriglobia bacterium]